MIGVLRDWAFEHRFGLWIVGTGILTNAACALLGCFLVLRRMSLLGDAISHAILPGLALSFILTGSRAIVPMFLGAMALGVLTAFLSQSLHRFARVSEDTSLGVVFTSLFALGVILIHVIGPSVDLDPGCVLYGLIEFVPLDTLALLGAEVPRAFLILGAVLLLDLGFVLLLWKELKISSFDPSLATTVGISAGLVHYLLMAMVAGTTVASFEAVGSILVIAMLIAPAAAAHLLTDRLGRMAAISVLIGASSAVLGYWGAVRLNTSTAGMMAAAAGGHYFLAVLASPRYGLVAKAFHRLAMAFRILREDALALLWRWNETRGESPLGLRDLTAALGGGLGPRAAVWLLRRRGHLEEEQGGLRLTAAGKRRARNLILSHRLWETYLSQRMGLPLDHLHEPAERMEHYITPQLQAALKDQLEAPSADPHGRPIPAGGEGGGRTGEVQR